MPTPVGVCGHSPKKRYVEVGGGLAFSGSNGRGGALARPFGRLRAPPEAEMVEMVDRGLSYYLVLVGLSTVLPVGCGFGGRGTIFQFELVSSWTGTVPSGYGPSFFEATCGF
jgi:hypothetical protein